MDMPKKTKKQFSTLKPLKIHAYVPHNKLFLIKLHGSSPRHTHA